MELMRCYSETGRFYVDLRISRFGDRWIASADTPDGPSLGCGETRLQAALLALDPVR